MEVKSIEHQNPIDNSELIITDKGRIYHLDLHPDDIADDIIIVGDQERVPVVSKYFDKIELKRAKREFVTHTGYLKKKRITVLSTGIGCDNIDIVLNELDALANINFKTRVTKKKLKSLNIVRIGTTGALQKNMSVDSYVISSYGLGFDGLLAFYDAKFNDDELALKKAFLQQIPWPADANQPYFVKGSDALIKKLGKDIIKGITATANGFYGPQGRSLRLSASVPEMNEYLNRFEYHGQKILNFEMETSALYGLSALLGHQSCTVCAVIANRFSGNYSKDYKKAVEDLIQIILERI